MTSKTASPQKTERLPAVERCSSPPEIAEAVQEVLPMAAEFTGYAPVDTDSKEDGRDDVISHLRTNFPHLDDTTLAAFAGYIAVNLASIWAKSEDPGQTALAVLGTTVLYSHATEALAESAGIKAAGE